MPFLLHLSFLQRRKYLTSLSCVCPIAEISCNFTSVNNITTHSKNSWSMCVVFGVPFLVTVPQYIVQQSKEPILTYWIHFAVRCISLLKGWTWFVVVSWQPIHNNWAAIKWRMAMLAIMQCHTPMEQLRCKLALKGSHLIMSITSSIPQGLHFLKWPKGLTQLSS